MKNCYDENKVEVGVDEVGRGCLLGPVVCCAYIIPQNIEEIDEKKFKYIKDSKKLSKKKRKEMYDYLIQNAVDYCVQFGSEKDVDEYNILQCTMNTMHKCIDNMTIQPNLLLIDGPYFRKYTGIEHRNIISGDSIYRNIAAASIIAKETRDNYIKELCENEPELNERYGLLTNMGYGTKKHIDGIKQYGITKYHRKSFGICKEY